MALARRRNPLLASTEAAAGASSSHATTRSPKDVAFRLAKVESARHTIGTLTRGMELSILTKGQFSEGEFIEALLERAVVEANGGPVDFCLSTWTATAKDVADLHYLHELGRMHRSRWLLDWTFCRRHPESFGQVNRLFGEEAARVSHNHAKFILARNDALDLVVWTSANLNMNPRLEFYVIREDRELAQWLTDWTDELFAALPPAFQQATQRKAHHKAKFREL